MALPVAVEKVVEVLTRTYGVASEFGTGRLLQFGGKLACSINYSKLLRGDKFFFGLAQRVTDAGYRYPKTELGEFAILICGTPDLTLVLPRKAVLSMMRGVKSGKLDVFRERGEYILQTTGHPKLTVTKYLNAFPASSAPQDKNIEQSVATSKVQKDRAHVAIQGSLIMLGRAEGCKVWVPPADRNLSFEETRFIEVTADKLPNFGFDEYSRRVIQNIDVLWLSGNIIEKAFEVESTTSIYSGLLRLNDLAIAQPNNRIHLVVVAQRDRRQQVYNQLCRPSFRQLAPKFGFVSAEDVKEQMQRLKALNLGQRGRVSGLLDIEHFQFSDDAYHFSDN